MKSCNGCNKLFTQTTLDKYDGVTCGRCYKKTLSQTEPEIKTLYQKKTIPKKLRKKVWLLRVGDHVNATCFVCDDEIDSFTFDCAHIVPEVYNGETTIDN